MTPRSDEPTFAPSMAANFWSNVRKLARDAVELVAYTRPPLRGSGWMAGSETTFRPVAFSTCAGVSVAPAGGGSVTQPGVTPPPPATAPGTGTRGPPPG